MTARRARNGRKNTSKETRYHLIFIPNLGLHMLTLMTAQQFTQLLETRSVLLRIAKDSPEAGFLASVCPVVQYPTVVVIRYARGTGTSTIRKLNE